MYSFVNSASFILMRLDGEAPHWLGSFKGSLTSCWDRRCIIAIVSLKCRSSYQGYMLCFWERWLYKKMLNRILLAWLYLLGEMKLICFNTIILHAETLFQNISHLLKNIISWQKLLLSNLCFLKHSSDIYILWFF